MPGSAPTAASPDSGAAELRGLAKDSFWTAAWQGSAALAQLAQIALVGHVLGIGDFGRLALVISFVTLVGQFFDVRVTTATTAFGARKLGSDMRATAGIFQLSYLIDAATGVLGFLVVVALSPVVGPRLVGSGGTDLILLFALTLLASTVDNSSLAILRLLGRFKLVAGAGAVLELLGVALVAGALWRFHDLTWVLVALVLHDAVAGAVNVRLAARAFGRASGGRSLAEPALSAARDERRGMLRMVFHTNVVSYARLTQAQLPTIVVGALAGTTQAGLYKLGMSAAAVVGRLSDPAYVAAVPRLSKLWAAGERERILGLMRYASALALGPLAAALALVVLLREPIVALLAGGQAHSAAAVVALGASAQAINGVLFWNMPLLFAANRAATVAGIALVGVLVQVVALLTLVPALDATGAAVAFLVTQVVANALATALAVATVRRLPSSYS
jgi:O-antigen/teichoic acid export membrane protein